MFEIDFFVETDNNKLQADICIFEFAFNYIFAQRNKLRMCVPVILKMGLYLIDRFKSFSAEF